MIKEPFIGVKYVVAVVPIGLAVPILGAALEHQANGAAALAARRSIIERGCHLELFDGVGIWQRHGVEVGQVEVVYVDSFQAEAVVGSALAVHIDIYDAAVGGAHVGELSG